MERVAFLIERTGERIECLLNPESFTLARQAGVRQVRTLAGVLSPGAGSDSPLLATGGGTTELVLELLFDVSKQTSPRPESSVQALTAPLWNLAENGADDAGGERRNAPPVVRFVWGKAWNICAVVVSVAERFEHFTSEGVPRRSWVKLRLLRCQDSPPADTPRLAADTDVERLLAELPEGEVQLHAVAGEGADDEPDAGQVERIDQLAYRYFGDASLWRLLADFNGLDDPSRLSPGTVLRIPSLGSVN